MARRGKKPKPFHPTWEVQYLDADGNVICDHWKRLEGVVS